MLWGISKGHLNLGKDERMRRPSFLVIVVMLLIVFSIFYHRPFALASSLFMNWTGGEGSYNGWWLNGIRDDMGAFDECTPWPVRSNSNKLINGWVIGNSTDDSGNRSTTILHTRDNGRTWRVQVGKQEWPNYNGNDISAVDSCTAWAALGSDESDLGIILHTTNGGWTWEEQALPEFVDQIKGIKGLTCHEAWAVSLAGKILHTTDGGKVWSIVEHPDITIHQVNRIDAIGYRKLLNRHELFADKDLINANVWIVDHYGGNVGMIHTLYNGEVWRQEEVPFEMSSGMHMVNAYSLRVVWAAAWGDSRLFRTTDGGETWEKVAQVGGQDDIDDMCAPTADSVWVVLNEGRDSGGIFHVQLRDGEQPEIHEFNPAPGYLYEGLTCTDDQSAVVVGYRVTSDDSVPDGVIVSTNDGGQHWKKHHVPVDDVDFWKASFVGARR